MKRRQALGLLAITTLLVGCGFNPIGPIIQIGMYWVEGEAHKYYDVEQSVLLEATKKSLEELKLPIQSEESDDNTISIRAGGEDDDVFKIRVIAVRENISKLSIRVNTFGDKPYAELIYQHVDEQPGVKSFASVEELNAAMEERALPRISRLVRPQVQR